MFPALHPYEASRLAALASQPVASVAVNPLLLPAKSNPRNGKASGPMTRVPLSLNWKKLKYF